jgi:glycosyltransferase involved in cell wall biosynthesis
MLPEISAIICTYERYDLLPKAIESLRCQRLSEHQFEIIVVDNSPDVDRSEQISKQFASIKNLRWIIEKTPGLSNARNVGLEAARSRLVAFIDDDAIADANWLRSLRAAFDDFGETAFVVGGKVEPIWEVGRPSWLPDDLLGSVSVVNWGGTARWALPTEWVAGTNIAFRAARLREVGGFSVHLGRKGNGHSLLSNDESEVIEKLVEKGGRLVFAPSAIVQHLVAVERLTQQWFRRRMAWQATSDYLQDTKRAFDSAPQYWDGVLEFFSRLPPSQRNPRGFYVEQPTAEMFRAQLSALYNFTLALLSGFHGVQEG